MWGTVPGVIVMAMMAVVSSQESLSLGEGGLEEDCACQGETSYGGALQGHLDDTVVRMPGIGRGIKRTLR